MSKEQNELELNWDGPFSLVTELDKICEYTGVYIWLAEIENKQRVLYIGSAKNIRNRIVAEVEETLGGACWLKDWKDGNGERWLPYNVVSMPVTASAKRVYRLMEFIRQKELRDHALKRIEMTKLFCAETDKHKQVERYLINIALKKHKAKHPGFIWLENEGVSFTEPIKNVSAIAHKYASGDVWDGQIQDFFRT